MSLNNPQKIVFDDVMMQFMLINIFGHDYIHDFSPSGLGADRLPTSFAQLTQISDFLIDNYAPSTSMHGGVRYGYIIKDKEKEAHKARIGHKERTDKEKRAENIEKTRNIIDANTFLFDTYDKNTTIDVNDDISYIVFNVLSYVDFQGNIEDSIHSAFIQVEQEIMKKSEIDDDNESNVTKGRIIALTKLFYQYFLDETYMYIKVLKMSPPSIMFYSLFNNETIQIKLKLGLLLLNGKNITNVLHLYQLVETIFESLYQEYISKYGVKEDKSQKKHKILGGDEPHRMSQSNIIEESPFVYWHNIPIYHDFLSKKRVSSPKTSASPQKQTARVITLDEARILKVQKEILLQDIYIIVDSSVSYDDIRNKQSEILNKINEYLQKSDITIIDKYMKEFESYFVSASKPERKSNINSNKIKLKARLEQILKIIIHPILSPLFKLIDVEETQILKQEVAKALQEKKIQKEQEKAKKGELGDKQIFEGNQICSLIARYSLQETGICDSNGDWNQTIEKIINNKKQSISELFFITEANILRKIWFSGKPGDLDTKLRNSIEKIITNDPILKNYIISPSIIENMKVPSNTRVIDNAIKSIPNNLKNKVSCPISSIMDGMSRCGYKSASSRLEPNPTHFNICNKDGNLFVDVSIDNFRTNNNDGFVDVKVRTSLSNIEYKIKNISLATGKELEGSEVFKSQTNFILNSFYEIQSRLGKVNWELFYHEKKKGIESGQRYMREFVTIGNYKALGDLCQEVNGTAINNAYTSGQNITNKWVFSNDRPSGIRIIAFLLLADSGISPNSIGGFMEKKSNNLLVRSRFGNVSEVKSDVISRNKSLKIPRTQSNKSQKIPKTQSNKSQKSRK